MENQESNEDVGMAAQAAQNKKNKIAKANGERVEETKEDLPSGAAPVETAAEETPVEAASVAEALVTEEAPAAVAPPAEEEEPIRIAGKTFKSQKEAFEYAEQLERDKLLAEAHAQGVREALQAQQPQAQPEPEPDFDTEFYSNPKETLKKIQNQARDEAVAMIRQEAAKEKAWNEFLSEYPDIRRQDAESVLSANMKTIGALPWDEGRRALAQTVYREYDEIANLRKPKVEMTNRKPAISPSGGTARGVTPAKADEKPLSFSDEIRNMKRKG